MIDIVPLGDKPPQNLNAAQIAFSETPQVPLYGITKDALSWLPLQDKETECWTVLVKGDLAKVSLDQLVGHHGVGYFLCASEDDAKFAAKFLRETTAGLEESDVTTFKGNTQLVGSSIVGAHVATLVAGFCREYWHTVVGEAVEDFAGIPDKCWAGEVAAMVYVDLKNESVVPLALPLRLDIHSCGGEPAKLLDALLPAWTLPEEIAEGEESIFQFLLNSMGLQPPLWAIAGVSDEHKIVHFPIVLQDPDTNQPHVPLFANAYVAQLALIDIAGPVQAQKVRPLLVPIIAPAHFLEVVGTIKVHNDVMKQHEKPDLMAILYVIFDEETKHELTPNFVDQRMARLNLLNVPALGFSLEVTAGREPGELAPRLTYEQVGNPFMLPSTKFIGQLFGDLLMTPNMVATRAADAKASTAVGSEVGEVSDKEDTSEEDASDG